MKVVFFEIMPGEEALLRPHLPPDLDVVFRQETLSDETSDLASGAQAISVFVKSELRKPLIDRLPDLKLITTRSMGYDHIDVEYAKSKGIMVNNVQTYASHPVAEFTFALLLSLVRKIVPASNHMRESMNLDQRGLSGFNLFGKTLGVAGTGRIGKNVVMIAKGFGMNILAYDVSPDEQFAAQQNFRYVPLAELIAQSDIITLHTPYLPETHHMMNGSLFALMKKGAILINTARGELVDTHALVAALHNGNLGGAGLDVLEGERDLREEAKMMTQNTPAADYELLAANHVLIDMPNVVVTPHIAFATSEAMQEISRVTAETISNFIAGKEQKYL
jgi:D-lactate dehydrogenase